ncbi:hypothetical protein [Nakamurella aerolata]|uniref:Uncharacterized protein n=1 Tax=Nakamurella aerolata TaxID=1656892 RepID=A0A849AJF9_9ACTN|nr:hypothetical protein [Nakamurella aerolata]NNG36952.1 hypothetical protein [Nakamurella aerolata]
MDFADISPWLSLGPTGALTGYLIRDNIRLRRENRDQEAAINSERQLRYAAEERAAKAVAKVGGLETQVQYLTTEVHRLNTMLGLQPLPLPAPPPPAAEGDDDDQS